MKNFFSALDDCLDTIKRGDDLESCLAAYPEYEDLLRIFLQEMSSERREQPEKNPEPPLEQVPFDQALDECIKAVGSGESSVSCYRRYPSYARKMKPWLDTVSDLHRYRRPGQLQPIIDPHQDVIPKVPFTQALEEYLQALKQNDQSVVLERYPYYAQKMQFWADQVPDDHGSIFTFPKPAAIDRLPRRIGILFSRLSLQMSVATSLSLFLFLFSGIGLVNAATATLPGDSLYPLKLTIEQVQLKIVPNDQHADLKEQFAEERRKETSTLIQSGLKQDVVFDGEITSVDRNKVTVSNVTVLLDGISDQLPVFQTGEAVHIEGYTSQKGVVIKKINLHSSDGKSTTFVATPPTPTATEVAFIPTPTFTPQASPTVTLLPPILPAFTLTSIPTAIPSLTPTGIPTDTPTLTPSWTPTNTPTLTPSWTPTETSTFTPTWTPTNTPTFAPTLTPTDLPTLEPTWTPTDVPTSVPTLMSTDLPTLEPAPMPTEIPLFAPTSQSTITADPTNDPPQ